MKKIEILSFIGCMLLLSSPVCQHMRELSLQRPGPVKVFFTKHLKKDIQVSISDSLLPLVAGMESPAENGFAFRLSTKK